MNTLQLLVEKQSLTSEQCTAAIDAMLEDPIQMGAFLALLKSKGETVDEILGLVRAMRAQMRPLRLDRPVLDIVGTGGDLAGTVNISTGSALMAARFGVPILKHGNRSVSSLCGSADVLEALGYPIHQSPEEIQTSIEKTGFGFCFAPDYHPIMQKIRPIRNALKIPTVFNIIGPLLNPAGTEHLQIGVYKEELVPIIANVLFQLGTKRSIVYCGHGMDELSCIGPTEALLVTDEGCSSLCIDPEQLGLALCKREDLLGGDAKYNAQLLKNPPEGLKNTLILNTAVALFLYGLANSIEEGVQIAKRKNHASLKEAIRKKPKAVIAEIKRASPSLGKIGSIPDAAKQAQIYASSGAVAISVLTSDRFDGSLSDLEAVKKSVAIPVLRKDFLTQEEQLKESDADVFLLIVAHLGKRTKEMLSAVHALGCEAILEIHNEEELQIAIDAGAEIIGVNQRNLTTFTMHPEVYALISLIPKHIVKIAESGVRNLDDAFKMFSMGYDAILVGEALTRNPKLCEELCSLKSAD